jgi:hypothetical protein
MTATPETVTTEQQPHLTLAGLAQQAGYAYRFAKAGQVTEAVEHLDAMERLIASYRADLGSGASEFGDPRFQRRIYIDGEGDPWIEIPMSPDDGTVAIVQLREDTDEAADSEEIRENTGGLREIGRCA